MAKKLRMDHKNISQNICLGSAWTPGVLMRVKQSSVEHVYSKTDCIYIL